PKILEKGSQWFADLGWARYGGTRLFALSGNVKKPGVYELPLGTPLRELIYEHGGGIQDDRALKAIIPGGASSAVLTADEVDISLDFDSLAKAGSMLGSGAVIAMHEGICMVKALHNIEHFFAHESCGQCTPCREGTGWVYKTLSRIVAGHGRMEDLHALRIHSRNMTGTSICALCDGAAMPLGSFVRKFEHEFEYYIKYKRSYVEARSETVSI